MLRSVFLGFALALGLAFSSGLSAQDSIASLVENEDYAAAFKKAEAEARAGDSFAHAWLGSFYENGNGVPQDMEKAVHHYRVSIANGEHSYPEWRIGVLIDEGKTKGMLEEAVALFERAAARGYTNAMVSLAVMQATGRGTPQNFEGAYENYMRAAQAGNMHAVQGVGILHSLGQGVAKDESEGAAWFMVASVGGNKSGRSRYEQAIAGMSESEKNAVRARALEIARELGLITD